jgi:hypothetical protein
MLYCMLPFSDSLQTWKLGPEVFSGLIRRFSSLTKNYKPFGTSLIGKDKLSFFCRTHFCRAKEKLSIFTRFYITELENNVDSFNYW